MAQTIAEKVVKRYEVMKQRRAVYDATCQELAEFILPKRSDIVRRTTMGTKKMQRVFDGTAIDANVKLAAFIAGSLTNMAIRWFSLKMSHLGLDDDKEAILWLDDCADILYTALRQSNFNTESQEFYQDLGAFGTALLLVEEKDGSLPFNGFMFRAEAMGAYVIGEDAEGSVNTVGRLVEMSYGAAAEKWGREALSESSQKKLEKNPDDMLSILHFVTPRSSPISNGKLAKNKPFGSLYVEYEKRYKLSEGGYDELPFACARWSKEAGEEYGSGPGHIALPDIKTLNKADELTLRGWSKIIAPPLKVRDDGVIGRVNTSPEALITVRDMEALQPLEQGGQWDVNAGLTQDRRASIRRVFFADQLQLPDKTIITATEVDRRIELAQQVLGPTIGRLEYEYLSPMISRCFKILLRKGQLPPVPQSVIQFAEKNNIAIDVQYEGPLSRAQRGGEVVSFNKWLSSIGAVKQINPESRILDNVDDDEAAQFLAKATGVNARLVRDPQKVQVLRQDITDQMNAARQQQAVTHAADTTQKMASANRDLAESGGGMPTSA